MPSAVARLERPTTPAGPESGSRAHRRADPAGGRPPVPVKLPGSGGRTRGPLRSPAVRRPAGANGSVAARASGRVGGKPDGSVNSRPNPSATRSGCTAAAETAIDLADARSWDHLIDLVGPTSLLVAAEARMGPRLLQSFTPEDVLQDVLLQAWSVRGKLEWRGLRPFRNWLLTVLDNRIRDLRGHQAAEKRGGAVHTIRISELVLARTGALPEQGEPETTATPSRLAIDREQACAVRDALLTLPEGLQDVLRLRLFEGLSSEETAKELGLGLAAVRYRLRRGSELYRARLLRLFCSPVEGRSTA